MRIQSPLAVALLVAMPLAGCLGLGDAGDAHDPTVENQAPAAEMIVEQETAWNGDRITFDARESQDPDGRIVSWVFDFGDGATYDAKNRSDARTHHVYREGGVYQATVTVRDDGTDRSGSLSDTTTEEVTINHKQRIVPGGGNGTSQYQEPFPMREGADKVVSNVTLRSILPIGSSKVEVKILHDSGDQVANKTITLDPDNEETVVIEGTLDRTGEHTLALHVRSGGVQFNGEIRVLHDQDPAGVGFGDAGDGPS